MNGLQGAFDRLLQVTFEWLPLLAGALVLLIIGVIIAGAIRRLVQAFLDRVGLDAQIRKATGGNVIERAVPSPAGLIATVAYWAVFLGFVSLAASVLGIEALDRFIAAVYGYIPQVIAALLIFLVASGLAAGTTTLVKNLMGDTPTGKMLESIVPVVIMGIATFMILTQLRIAPAIVTITYAAIVGSVALGSALAFGLGGRDVAARLLESSYEKAKQSKDQVKHDMKLGKTRGKEEIQQRRG